MQTKYSFLIFLYLILMVGTTTAQNLRLAHIFTNENARRIRMPNGDERFLTTSRASLDIKMYSGDYQLMRTYNYGSWTNNERIPISDAYITEIGRDTLLKFQYFYHFKVGFRNENGRILLEKPTDTIFRYYFSEIKGLKTRLVGVYPVDNKYSFCLFDTLNLGLQQCFPERNFIRANCNGLGERMITTKFTDARREKQDAVVLNGNFDTLAKIRLPNNATNQFIAHDFGLGTVPMFGVESAAKPGQLPFYSTKIFDLAGNLRFSDSVSTRFSYVKYAHLGAWLGKLEVTFNQGIADTTYRLLSLTDFSVVHEMKRVSEVRLVNLGVAGEKILAYGWAGDTFHLYNLDFTLYKKIPFYPSFRGGGIWHISDNLLNNDADFEIFYVKSDFMTGTWQLTIANSRGQHLLSFSSFSGFDISQIPGMKNKLIVIAGYQTFVYDLETSTISAVSNLTLAQPLIFPNPFTDNLTIQLNNDALKGPLSIRLIDVLGRQQFKGKMTEKTFQLPNLSYLPKGIYVLELSNADNRVIQKVIKQ